MDDSAFNGIKHDMFSFISVCISAVVFVPFPGSYSFSLQLSFMFARFKPPEQVSRIMLPVINHDAV